MRVENHYCLICDDVRHELGGKLTIVGLYSNDVKLPRGDWERSEASVALKNLSFVNVFKGLHGLHSVAFHLIDPDGEIIGNQQNAAEQDFGAEPGFHNLVVNLTPFRISKLGEYRHVVVIDDDEYVTPFSISLES